MSTTHFVLYGLAFVANVVVAPALLNAGLCRPTPKAVAGMFVLMAGSALLGVAAMLP